VVVVVVLVVPAGLVAVVVVLVNPDLIAVALVAIVVRVMTVDADLAANLLPRAQLDAMERAHLAFAPDVDRHAVAGVLVPHPRGEIGSAANAMIVEADDDVALTETGPVRGTGLVHAGDDHALAAVAVA